MSKKMRFEELPTGRMFQMLRLFRKLALLARFGFLSLTLLGIFVETACAETPKGFVPLFNGKDLSGWKGLVADPKKAIEMSPQEKTEAQDKLDERMRSHWQVVDGILEFDGRGDSLGTEKDYTNFEMYIDWKITRGGDSGIYLRGVPQVQIWDVAYEALQKHGADKGSGSLWNNRHHSRFPLVKADKPIGDWNTFYIKMLGCRVTVKLNGKLVVDNEVLENYWEPDKPIPTTGSIVLQNHGGKLWFRNIYIRELTDPKKKAPAERAAISPSEEPIQLFDGQTLGGLYTWLQDTKYEDPRQVFRVTNGVLHVTGDAYGGVVTKEQYCDYHMVLEYKWGERTWKERKGKARDSGVLVHSVGADGGHKGIWMPSIEVQIIEGGVGDFIMVHGDDRQGDPVDISLSSKVSTDRDGEIVWNMSGATETFNLEKLRRINWSGRDPDWKDVRDFRGTNDPDSPSGEWTRLDVRCDGDSIIVFVNGIKVNEAFDVRPTEGRLQLQSELAEIHIRRWELWPLKQSPIPDSPQ